MTINKASAAHVAEAGSTIDASAADLTITQTGTTPSFANGGLLTIGASHTVTVTGGTMTNAATGTIAGNGNLNVSGTAFSNGGTLSPGSSAGLLTLTGNDPEVAGGTLKIEIGGTTPGTGHDRMVVTGSATLASTLNVSLINGYVPNPGDQFRVLTFASSTGGFAHINGLNLGGGLSLDPRLDATGLTLVVVGETWVRLLPTGASPLARDSHDATFDPTNDRMKVFGGRGDSGPLNDVWVLTNANGIGGTQAWSHLAPTGGPPAARANATAVYDGASNRMIVYGGDDETGVTPAMFGDVWVLTNANGLGGAPVWSQLSPTGGPPPVRTQHGAAYDPATNTMIVFGGNPTAGACATGLNDVWLLSNANGLGGAPVWTQLSPTGGPPAGRRSMNVAYDSANNLLLVMGGDLDCSTSSGEAWTLSHANGQGGAAAWSLLGPSGAPPSAWSLHSGVFDPGLDRFTGFGGLISGVATNNVFSLSTANGIGGPSAWLDLSPTLYRPDPRSLHSAVVDGTNHRMVMFAGLTAGGRVNDVWELELTQGRIVAVPPPPAPQQPRFTGFSRPLAPNPARAGVTFAIALARPCGVELSVHDLAGRSVATLFHGSLDAGDHPFSWSGVTNDGRRAAPGIYLIHLVAGSVSQSRRICLLP